ncbi:peptidoglycan/LPS O-acetylase OafA/YrhL [Larkinella arboricola]|uniref:Peptidoglycan/LPS O-acetylase OafA/YrhL n=1 Tax=Larkinella arboricola TaxID=643671 RepID=A0A327XES5_LARAB|nr:acyltransferase [Larkinella arboricola]RAK02736.1 peptidoglycan/LPS O-acetylase OafA/YrhL [Larkinella arboricola]
MTSTPSGHAASANPTSKKPFNHLKQLDGIRCIAVTLVLISHWMAGHTTLPIGSLGELGVTIFFVLSGFLIIRILLSGKDQLEQSPEKTPGSYFKNFYIRRAIRILPVYYVTVLVLALIGEPGIRQTLPWLLLHGTNYYVILNNTWIGTADHLWSLAVEQQVYLFLPLLIFFVPQRFIPLTAGIMIVGSVALRFIFYLMDLPWAVQYIFTLTCMDPFGFGGVLAYGYLYRRSWFEQFFRGRWWLPLSILSFFAVVFLYEFLPKVNHVNVMNYIWERFAASLLGFFLIGRGILGFNGWMKWLLENRVSQHIGLVSYGIYLFHNFIYNYYHTPPTHFTLRLWNHLTNYVPLLNAHYSFQLLYFAGLTIGLATLSWYLLEKPINSLKVSFS